MKSRVVRACVVGVSSTLIVPAQFARAEAPPPPYGLGDAVRSAEQARREAPPAERPNVAVPQSAEPRFTMPEDQKLFVRHIKIDGPDLVGADDIRAALSPYENRKLTLGEIYDAADAITNLYRAEGYVVAKAYVPEQDARKGALTLKVIAGSYGSVTIDNKSLVRSDYLQNVVDRALAGSPYIRKDELERAMLLDADLAGAGAPRISIAPGQKPETSDLVFSPPEARRIEGYVLGDNFGSPYTGRIRSSGSFTLNSPTGYGDRLTGFGVVSETGGLVNGRVAYAPPPTYGGLRGEASFFETTYKLGGVYRDSRATGQANGFSLDIVYPWKRQREESFYLFSNFTHKYLDDKVFDVSLARRYIEVGTIGMTHDMLGSLFDMPFVTGTSLSASGGVLRFPDPAERTGNKAGIDTAGAFGRVNLSFSSTLAMTPELSLSLMLRAQKAIGRNLDSSEKLGLTGVFGVRSYDEGLAGDSGVVTTPEIRYALPSVENYRHSFGVFSDLGAIWLEHPGYTVTQRAFSPLSDIGAGYYATYDLTSVEASPARSLFFKAQVAHSLGWRTVAPSYDQYTKGLVQLGVTY
jgi:hemolysin activation/secretion protein